MIRICVLAQRRALCLHESQPRRLPTGFAATRQRSRSLRLCPRNHRLTVFSDCEHGRARAVATSINGGSRTSTD